MSPRKDPERVFLGWDRPFVAAVVDWLEARGGADRELGRITLVVPGRRAGRRILELLALAPTHGRGVLVPPQIVTLGALPETLYRPERPIAGELRQLLARLHALRTAPEELRRALTPASEVELDDELDRVGLVEELERLETELAAEALTPAEAARRLGQRLEPGEAARWQAVVALSEASEEILAGQGFVGRQRARLEARGTGVEVPEAAGTEPMPAMVLVGMVDLGGLFRRLLGRWPEPVLALVHAPPELADAFDSWGCPRPERWIEAPALPRSYELEVVDRPRDQAAMVATTVRRICADSGAPFSAGEVSVGLGDPTSAWRVHDALELAGVPSHLPRGRAFFRTRPAQLLSGLARLRASRRLEDLASSLRHPDVESWLADWRPPEPPEGVSERPMAAAIERRDWPTLLDLYSHATLLRRLDGEWPGDPGAAAVVRSLAERVGSLLPNDATLALPEWSSSLLQLLREVYGEMPLVLDRPEEAELAEALSLLAEALGEQAEVPANDPSTPRFSGPQAITFTLGRLADQVLAAGDGAGRGVEILGWLELALDDAPALVLLGLNEGHLPTRVEGDPFLPDGARRILGLLDHRRRFARDLFLLSAVLHSRQRVSLIAGRRGNDDEPLVPSRLLLAGDEEELPARLLAFFAPHAVQSKPAELLVHRERSGLLLHPPEAVPVVQELPVTAFRDYLQCPYRFYLKHILRLQPQRDLPPELDGGAFGRISHEVLRAFGSGALADCDRPAEVGRHLEEIADEVARRHLGTAPPVATRIQLANLKRRLWVFAEWQAAQVEAGWRIDRAHLEARLSAELPVDGEPFRIVGQIDRIDRHAELGVRILDYKTGEVPRTPEEVHAELANGDRRWRDLQLPLYQLLARSQGVEGSPELGFVLLSRELSHPTYLRAPWSLLEIEAAWRIAEDVVRQLRRGAFWPPSPPPPFEDAYARLLVGRPDAPPAALLDRR